MHHGVRDLDARGKAVENEPADLVLENRDQVSKLPQILLRAMDRCRQMAFEAAGNRQNLIAADSSTIVPRTPSQAVA